MWARQSSGVAALVVLMLTALPIGNGLQCRTYSPQQCLFDTNDSAPTAYPQPLHPSSFRLDAETSCPFHRSGVFQHSECDDDFMAEARSDLPTADDAAFCTSGSLPGEFKRQGEQYIFMPHPDSKCSYFDYRRSEVPAVLPRLVLLQHLLRSYACIAQFVRYSGSPSYMSIPQELGISQTL